VKSVPPRALFVIVKMLPAGPRTSPKFGPFSLISRQVHLRILAPEPIKISVPVFGGKLETAIDSAISNWTNFLAGYGLTVSFTRENAAILMDNTVAAQARAPRAGSRSFAPIWDADLPACDVGATPDDDKRMTDTFGKLARSGGASADSQPS
jgi:hypothetical protein